MEERPSGRERPGASGRRSLAIEGPLAVAVSGGVDSVTLATFAHRTAASRVEMFHAVSPAVPREATERVERLASAQGWRLRIVDAGEFTDKSYLANPVDRCFFCKTNLYGCIASLSDSQILSGANLDDLGEYRPGLNAAKLHSVRHPYLEAKVDKTAVRSLARDLGLARLVRTARCPLPFESGRDRHRHSLGGPEGDPCGRAKHCERFSDRHRALQGASDGSRDRARSRHPRGD